MHSIQEQHSMAWHSMANYLYTASQSRQQCKDYIPSHHITSHHVTESVSQPATHQEEEARAQQHRREGSYVPEEQLHGHAALALLLWHLAEHSTAQHST